MAAVQRYLLPAGVCDGCHTGWLLFNDACYLLVNCSVTFDDAVVSRLTEEKIAAVLLVQPEKIKDHNVYRCPTMFVRIR
jgi:hypothetical protein